MENIISEGELLIKEEIKVEPLDEVIKTVYEPLAIKQEDLVAEQNEDHQATLENQEEVSPVIQDIKKEESSGLGNIIYAIKDTGVECYNVSLVEPDSKPPLPEKSENKKSSTSPHPYLRCFHCGLHFNSSKIFIRHVDERVCREQISCEICGKKFKSKNNLITHGSVHTQEKKFTCQVCGKHFRISTLLWQHSFTHKERNFECDICHKKFKTSSNLLQHKYGHVTEKAFKCQFCDKAFRKKQVLKVHELIHSEVRPFVCGVCNTGFTMKNAFKLHQKKKNHFEESVKQKKMKRGRPKGTKRVRTVTDQPNNNRNTNDKEN